MIIALRSFQRFSRPFTYLFLFINFFPFFLNAQATVADSLEQIVETETDPILRSDALYELAKQFIRKDPDRTMDYIRSCIEIAEKGGYQEGLCDCAMAKGLVHQHQSQFDSAQVLFQKVLTISQDLADTSLMTRAIGNLGMVSRRMGNYDDAINFFLDALRLNEQKEDKGLEAHLLSDIGHIYALTDDWDKSLEFQQKAMKIYRDIDNQRGIATVSNSIGVVYQENLKLDSAYVYFNISLKLKEKMENWYGWVTTKGNICRLLTDKGETSAALLCFEELLPVEERLDAKADLGRSLTNLAYLHLDLKQAKKGIDYAMRSLKIAETTGDLKMLRGANQVLELLHEKRGNFEKALFFGKKTRILNDSLLNEAKAKQISELEIAYETEKKEQQIELQRLEIDNQQQKIRWQRTLTGGIITVFLALFAFLFWYTKQKQERRRQLAIVQHQEHLLQVTVETVEAERKRISKDLHDGIGQQLTGLKMAWQQLTDNWRKQNPQQAENLENLTTILSDATNEVRSISHQMMPAALRELGLKAAMEDMLKKSFTHSNIDYEFDNHGVDGRFAENIEIGLYRIAQELVNNILKHSNAKQVNVELFSTKSHLVLIIEDDGRGFDFKTTEEVGNGLNNISSRAKSVNGKILFEQGENRGVSATVRVPLG